MARKFLTPIDLGKLEIQNVAAQNLASAPSSPVKGQFYMNTSDNTLYWWNGTAWVSAAGGGTGFPGYGAVTPQTTFGAASADGVATTTSRSDHTHGTPVHNAAAHSTIPLNTFSAPTGDVNMAGFKLITLGDPTAPADTANKRYVDNAVAGLSWKEAVRVATTANITLSGLGTAIDGVTLASGDRVLVKNQTNAQDNGIYGAASTSWTRRSDADEAADMEGLACFVMEGTTLADTAWVCTTNPPITLGTTPLTFAQFAGGAGVPTNRQIIAGAGLTGGGDLSADRTLNVVAADTSLNIAADAMSVVFSGSGSVAMAARSDHTHAGVYTQKIATGCNAATSTLVNHNLNTRNVLVDVYRTATPWDSIDADIERTDANNVTVRFAVAPASNEYTILVVG